MRISEHEASQALREIQDAAHQVRQRSAHYMVGPILILWGVVWSACYLITQFAPAISGWGWLVGDTIGLGGTGLIAWIAVRRAPVRSKTSDRIGRRVGWFWFALFSYAGIWLAMFWPWNGDQIGVFLVTLVMFAYLVMGLWLEVPFLTGLGLAVTALAAGGYFASMFFFPGYLSLWMAVTGGGALLSSGIYLVRKWG